MNDSPELIEEPAEASPDYFKAPTRGKGIRRMNKRPLLIVAAISSIFFVGVAYTYYSRANDAANGGDSSTDMKKIFGVAEAPVKRPAGPDVNMPERLPAVYVQEQGEMREAAMPESEASRRAREEKVAAYKAALSADPTIGTFSRKETNQIQQADNSMNMPPRDGDQLGDSDQNMQKEKREFLNSFEAPESPYLKQVRMGPVSDTEIKAGSIIPGVMISGVNSDLPGQIIGQVRQNVYDSATGRHLLIPAGAKIVGTYDSSVAAGQERVLVAWNRIIFPDSSSISLEAMPGADQSGYAGFNEKVDNHYWRTFGNAFLLSLFSAGIQLSQPSVGVNGTFTSQSIMAAAIGRQLGQLGMQLARRNLNIQPTLEISPGYQFSIMVTKDMILPTWNGHPLAKN